MRRLAYLISQTAGKFALAVGCCLMLSPMPAVAQVSVSIGGGVQIRPAVPVIRPAVPGGQIQPAVPGGQIQPAVRSESNGNCNRGSYGTYRPGCGGNRTGYGGLWIGGGGYVVQTPTYVPYPVQVQPQPENFTLTAPSVYATLSIPSGSGDGRELIVDVIRGARENSPSAQLSPTQVASVRAEQAAAALNLLKPDLPSDKLMEFLVQPDQRVQLQALELILGRGEEGLAALRQGAASPDGDMRAASLAGLTQAAANPQRLALAGNVLPLLFDALEDSDVQVRRIAAGGVGLLAPAANVELTVQRLMSMLRDPDDEVRAQAVQSLAWINEPAIGPLIKAMSSQSDQLRNAASEALGLIGPPAIAKLQAALESSAPEVRYSAASALGDIGTAAAAAAPTLRRLAAEDPDSDVRYYAQSALRKIDR